MPCIHLNLKSFFYYPGAKKQLIRPFSNPLLRAKRTRTKLIHVRLQRGPAEGRPPGSRCLSWSARVTASHTFAPELCLRPCFFFLGGGICTLPLDFAAENGQIAGYLKFNLYLYDDFSCTRNIDFLALKNATCVRRPMCPPLGHPAN